MRVANLDFLTWVTVAVVVIGLANGAKSVLGEAKGVSGTQHDVASPDSPVCIYCHVPEDPEGEPLLASGGEVDGALSGLKSLCFSCHDGTVTSIGMYVFDPERTMHPRNVGKSGQDCDRCHDPHETGYGKFLRIPGGAGFCENCHSGVGVASGHPVDIDARAAGIEPADSSWDPAHEDFNGTRLWNLEGTGPGNYVKCLTCHTTHGGQPGTPFHTIPVQPTNPDSASLCLNCHFDAAGP